MVGIVFILFCLVASGYCYQSLTDPDVIKVGVEFLKEKIGHRLEWEWNTDWAQAIADEFDYQTIPRTKNTVDVHDLWGINVYVFRDAQPVPNCKKEERTSVNRMSKLLENAAVELQAAEYPNADDIIGVGVGVRIIGNILSLHILRAYFVLLKRTGYFERFNFKQALFLHEAIMGAESEVYAIICAMEEHPPPQIQRKSKFALAIIGGPDSKTLLSAGATNQWESVSVTGIAIQEIRQFGDTCLRGYTYLLGIARLMDGKIFVVGKLVLKAAAVLEKVPDIGQDLFIAAMKVNEDGKGRAPLPISHAPEPVKDETHQATIEQEKKKGQISYAGHDGDGVSTNEKKESEIYLPVLQANSETMAYL